MSHLPQTPKAVYVYDYVFRIGLAKASMRARLCPGWSGLAELVITVLVDGLNGAVGVILFSAGGLTRSEVDDIMRGYFDGHKWYKVEGADIYPVLGESGRIL